MTDHLLSLQNAHNAIGQPGTQDLVKSDELIYVECVKICQGTSTATSHKAAILIRRKLRAKLIYINYTK